jgi:hypothetical protein
LRMFCVVLLTVNPSTYSELPTFCISDWFVAFNVGICFYFFV